MKNAPFVQSRFKSGMLAMFSPLVSAITEVGKEIVKPEPVAVTAAVVPIVLGLIGKGVEKLCDHAADKLNVSLLNHLCFASHADLFQDLHNEAESRPADDCEMLAKWHELTDHAAKDKTWVSSLSLDGMPIVWTFALGAIPPSQFHSVHRWKRWCWQDSPRYGGDCPWRFEPFGRSHIQPGK